MADDSLFPGALDVGLSTAWLATQTKTGHAGAHNTIASAIKKLQIEVGYPDASGPGHTSIKSRVDALVAVADAYSVTYTTTLRTLDEATATTNNIVDFLGTLIADIKALT